MDESGQIAEPWRLESHMGVAPYPHADGGPPPAEEEPERRFERPEPAASDAATAAPLER